MGKIMIKYRTGVIPVGAGSVHPARVFCAGYENEKHSGNLTQAETIAL